MSHILEQHRNHDFKSEKRLYEHGTRELLDCPSKICTTQVYGVQAATKIASIFTWINDCYSEKVHILITVQVTRLNNNDPLTNLRLQVPTLLFTKAFETSLANDKQSTVFAQWCEFSIQLCQKYHGWLATVKFTASSFFSISFEGPGEKLFELCLGELYFQPITAESCKSFTWLRHDYNTKELTQLLPLIHELQVLCMAHVWHNTINSEITSFTHSLKDDFIHCYINDSLRWFSIC